MRVLVIGAGGREHAIIWKLSQSEKVDKIFCAPGNAGIANIAECVSIGVMEFEKLVDFAKKEAIDLVVVGPDDPLAAGIVDSFDGSGIRVFGPCKSGARLEGSKAFSKDFMKKHNIPTAAYEVFDDSKEALKYLQTAQYPTVIKADGLALGKGVSIVEDYESAAAVINDMMENKIFGESGSTVVIEEFLVGSEVSVLTFVDGNVVKQMVPAQDHKRIYEGNKGPNTGGMGTICPPPEYTDELKDICQKEIFDKTIEGLKKDGIEFKGIIFFGVILTEKGPKVLEYNVRFGDPETQSVLLRLENDLVDVFEACIDGKLNEVDLKWKDGASCCVIVASGGYPVKYAKGYEITGLSEAEKDNDIVVFHSGTANKEGKVVTNGGRVLGVSAYGANVDEALDKAYAAIDKIEFKDKFFRKDIGRVKVDK